MINIYEDLKGRIDCSNDYMSFIRYDFFMDEMNQSFLKRNIDLSKYSCLDFLKLQVSYDAMLLSIYKEKCSDKLAKDSFLAKVTDEFLERAISFVTSKKDNKYYLGSFSYDDKLKVLDVLRNKLTHGDYYIDGDDIVFGDIELKKNPTNLTRVSISGINTLTVILTNGQLFNLRNTNRRTMILSKRISNSDKVTNKKSFRDLCKKLYIVTFSDNPTNGVRSTEYCTARDTFLKTFREQLANLQSAYPLYSMKDLIHLVVKNSKPILDRYGIDFSIDVKSIYDSNCLKTLEKEYQLFEYASSYPAIDQANLISLLTEEYENPTFKEEKLKAALLNNLLYIEGKAKPDREKFDLLHISPTIMDDITIASYLCSFYINYIYGLENIYSHSSETTLKDIIDGNVLDFSLLDLDSLYDPSMKILVSFIPFNDELLSIKKDNDKCKEAYDRNVDNKKKYLENNNVVNPSVVYRFDKIIKESKEKYEESLIRYNKAVMFMRRFDKYVKNYNILLNIRDSIAHGNYELLMRLEAGKDCLLDSELDFNNICNGNINYHLLISIRNFMSIFNDSNNKVLLDFLNSKCPTLDTGSPIKKEMN